MIWSEWKKEYDKIIDILNINEKEDEKSAKILETYLSDLLKQKKGYIQQKLETIFHNPIIIAGAGPSLEQDFNAFLKVNKAHNIKLISVNGATTLFQMKNITPDVVITDLDGDLNSIKWAILKDVVTLIHAHGDNIHLISRFFNQNESILRKHMVWGTTQCKPDQILFNYGGFTDGDRAIIMAFHFQSPLIGLIGFDFGKKIGKYSTMNSPIEKSKSLKNRKFKIALKLISSYHHLHNGIRVNITSQGEDIPGFPRNNISTFIRKAVEFQN